MDNESLSSLPQPVQTAIRWLKRERVDNASRDLQIKRLNNAYDARIYNLDDDGSQQQVMSRSLTDVIAGPGQGSNSRYSEVPVPMVRSITDDWVSVMAISPNHMCPPTSPGEPTSERDADRREQIVAGIFWDSWLDFRIQEGAHFRSLQGAELLHSLPDPFDHRVRIDTRSPHRTYARLLNSRRELMYMAWDWEEFTDYILDTWPGIEKLLGEEHGFFKKGGKVERPDKLVMTEWYDRQNRIVLIGDRWVDGVPWAEHKWGFVPGQVVPNIVGVGLWGQSDVQHAVQLSQLYGEIVSMAQDGLFQSIYDIPIIFDDNAVSRIDVGPHEALQMSSKARTGSLRQNVKMPETSLMLDILERIMRLASGWPKVQSSEMDSPIISGKAFVAAQGPVAARAAVKLLTYAAALERVTGYALRLYERVFPNEEIQLMTVPGAVRNAVVAARGSVGGQVSFVPSRDIAGNYHVVINFPPGGADQYRATLEQLQLLEAGVISVETMRQSRVGIDSQAEEMRTEREARQKAALQAEQATVMAQAQMALQAQMMAAQSGAAPPPGQAGAEATVPPAGGTTGPSPGGPGGETLPMTPAETPARKEAAMGAVGQQGQWEKVTRGQVKAEMQAVTPIRGRVFLTGAIARLGATTGLINVALTDMIDKATLTQKTSFGRQRRLLFEQASPDVEPSKVMVEVTPGV